MTDAADYARLVTAARGAAERHRTAAELVRVETRALEDYKLDHAGLHAARELLQKVAAELQQEVHDQIASVVAAALGTVFPGRGYSFDIKFEMRRGKTEADLWLLKDGHPVKPTEADSGGVVQVAAFALRVACLMLSTPRRRRVLFLDEPFGMVDREHVGNVAALLESTAQDLGVQIVLVTHNPELQVGRVIRLEK